MTKSFDRPSQREDGFVLIAVVWIVGALAVLASIYATYAANSAAAAHLPDDRLRAEAAIRAGVELAAYQILAVPPAARPSHGAFDARLGPADISVRYRSEAGRIDLNAAPKDLLSGLFRSAGAGDAAANDADRVIAWRKPVEPNADNPEAAAYKAAGLGYAPRQGPFNSASELSLVLGLSPALVQKILPKVTVFSGSAQVDAAAADPDVLAALPGVTPDILGKVLKARAVNPGDADAIAQSLGPASDRVTAAAGKTLRAAIAVRLDDGRSIAAEVVFRLKDSGDEPYDILLWRDDFDAPLREE